MAKNKRDWAAINARKGKAYNPKDTGNSRGAASPKGPKAAKPQKPQGPKRERYGDTPADHPFDEKNMIIGRNPVIEALKNGRDMEKLLVVKGGEGSIAKIVAMAREQGVTIYQSDRAALDRLACGRPHQGVVAFASAYAYGTMEDIFEKAKSRGEEPLVVVLDNLEDPHNLGAIMRTCECAGAHGVIIPKRHACGLTEVVAKASAGAVEYVPCVRVANIGQAIDELKREGFWVAACDMGGQPYYRQDLTGRLAVVIGSEGAGISRLVKEKCDFTVSMPMVGRITSLNASNAAAVLMYEVRRQRDERQ